MRKKKGRRQKGKNDDIGLINNQDEKNLHSWFLLFSDLRFQGNCRSFKPRLDILWFYFC